MILYPKARRYVAPDVARAIVQALPPFVTPVGVFVDESVETMRQLATQIGLRTLQLHGNETPEVVASLGEFTILKSIRVNASLAATLESWRDAIVTNRLRHLQGFVLETDVTGQSGGTGMANNWSAIRDSQTRGIWNHLPQLIAAGGLTPETVAEVVRQIRPYAVDVSSGVEDAFGIKSETKVRAFVDAVRNASR
jgi:phosphoribosylanthranilate isomerase